MILRELFHKNIQLNELFNFSYPYSMTDDGKYILGGKRRKYTADTPAGELEVHFFIDPIDTITIAFTVNNEVVITGQGKGEQFRIFGTVLEIIKNHLPELINDQTKKIICSADEFESSRISLYKKLVPKIAQILGDKWDFSEKFDKDYHDFVWTKKEINDQILTELFNFSYPYSESTSIGKNIKRFHSETPTGRLRVSFQLLPQDALDISFSVNGEYRLYNQSKGEQFKLLGTVWQIIKDQLPTLITDQVKQIIFSADKKEPSRISFYKRIAPKLSNLLGSNWDYQYKEFNGVDEVYYLWDKKKDTQTLTELFNFSYPYELSSSITDDQYIQKQYIAKTPIGELQVDISKIIDIIDFSFSIDNQYSLTGGGKGEQFRILGTVSEIIKNHLTELINDDVKMVYFDADPNESSRISLYERLAPKITKLLGSEWKLDIDKIDGRYIWERMI